VSTVAERRCKGRNKRGQPCAGIVVGSDGYCAIHSPTSSLDMRDLGRRGGSARSQPSGNETLREYLRREVPPERVWSALEAAMQGKNESARVAAVKVLAQELYEPEQQDDQVARWRAESEANASQYRRKLYELIERRARDLLLTAVAAAELTDETREQLERLLNVHLEADRRLRGVPADPEA
jgi:hypothetical protein